MDLKAMGHLGVSVYLIPLVVLTIFAINTGFRRYNEWKFSRDHQCGKPKVVSSGFIRLGRVISLLSAMKAGESLELMRNWHKQHGTTFRTSLGRRVIITIDPKNVQAILAHKFQDFDLGCRNKAMAPLLGQGIFASDGHLWEHSRALIRPNFARNQVAEVGLYEKHVSNLIANIPLDGSTVDLQELFFQMTMDSATEFLLGESVESLNSGVKQPSFTKDFNTSQDGLAIRSRLGPLMMLYRDTKFSKATVDCRLFVDQFVQRALDYRTACLEGKEDVKGLGSRYVFMYELAKQTADRKQLTDQILNILLAGRDTTAGLLSIAFFILARRPDVWNKLREEVIKVHEERPGFESLKSMTYLTWVLNETLRLYPSVPVNARAANKDTYLPVGGGPNGTDPVFVPKGQEVIYSVYSMHRLPSVYGPDATEFRPERWASLKPGWAYIPFNGGPRICLGQQFALTEAGYTVMRLVRHFKSIEPRDEQPFKEGLTLTLASKYGTKVGLTLA